MSNYRGDWSTVHQRNGITTQVECRLVLVEIVDVADKPYGTTNGGLVVWPGEKEPNGEPVRWIVIREEPKPTHVRGDGSWCNMREDQ